LKRYKELRGTKIINLSTKLPVYEVRAKKRFSRDYIRTRQGDATAYLELRSGQDPMFGIEHSSNTYGILRPVWPLKDVVEFVKNRDKRRDERSSSRERDSLSIGGPLFVENLRAAVEEAVQTVRT
jgi:hypothetical protein